MFELGALRDSRVWHEAYMEGFKEGFQIGFQQAFKSANNAVVIAAGSLEVQQQVVRNGLAQGMSAKEIAKLLEISVAQVRRLAKKATG
jgi:DNA-binding NarL/FixJ family response regulator